SRRSRRLRRSTTRRCARRRCGRVGTELASSRMPRRAAVAVLLVLSLGTGVALAGKGKTKGEKEKRDKARELEAMAELAEQGGDVDKAIGLLDELRKVCAQKGPPCETKDADLLEQIGWLCLKSKACAPRRPALIEELQKKAPKKKELLHDLKDSLAPGAD